MHYTIIVGLAAEDIKAVLKGRPEAKPGYGSTPNAAVRELIENNPAIFRIEIRQGNPLDPEAM